jgi:hypothetical protein
MSHFNIPLLLPTEPQLFEKLDACSLELATASKVTAAASHTL